MRRGSGDRRGYARHPPRWAGRSRRARGRHAAMVEPRLARGDPAQNYNAAALGRAAWGCRPQPLPANARCRSGRPRLLSDDGDARPAGRTDLAQPGGPHSFSAVAGRIANLARRARHGGGRGPTVHGPYAALRRRHEAESFLAPFRFRQNPDVPGVVERDPAACINNKAGPLVRGQRLWVVESRGMEPKTVERSRPGLIDCRLQQVGAEPAPDKVGDEPEITQLRLARRRSI